MSSFLASPVKMETKSIYPVENYGSAMAPFYSTLSIWVGGIVLVAMMKVTLSEERKKKTSSCKKLSDLLWQIFAVFYYGAHSKRFNLSGRFILSGYSM